MDLSNIELFSSLSFKEVERVQQIAKRIHLSRGDIIFKEGDYEKNIYIIETGQIEIFKKNPVLGEQMVALLKNGDYFGEMAFFEKSANRSATARTVQATSLIVIEAKDFDLLLHNHPSISLKLLANLSQRLRTTTQKITQNSKIVNLDTCKVITIASAKDGYGKSTMAVTLAKIMATELKKRILYVDTDFYFGSGTQLIGVHSPRSIIDICKKMISEDENFKMTEECIKISENLWAVPAPRSFLEAESVKSQSILKILKKAREDFDYVIIDTGSSFNENFFTVLDTADVMFFLVDFDNISSISDNVRFFHGISKLSYPKNRIILLGSNIGPEFPTVKTEKIFPYPVVGGLPKIPGYSPQFGKSPYEISSTGPYCEIVRLLIRNVFKENLLKQTHAKNGIFSKIFGNNNPDKVINDKLDHIYTTPENTFAPIISSKDVRSQVKYVRYNLLFGYLTEAKNNLLAFMEYSQTSAPLCELLGEIYLKEGLRSEALEAFQKAVSIDPKQHVALAFLGVLTASPEKYQQGLQSVKEKIAQNPSHLDLLNDLGKILMKNEMFEEALVEFDKALQKNPKYLEVIINKSVCLSNLKRESEAIELLFSVPNKNPRIFSTLGNVLYESGRLYLSYMSYTKALSMYPEYPGIRERVSELASYLRKLDSVIDLHERFVNTNPTFPDLHAKLANFYHLAGKTEVAIEEYKKAIELNPGYVEAATMLEAIQKDNIWKVAKDELEDNFDDETNLTRNFKVTLNFNDLAENLSDLPEDASLKVKNVRNSKTLKKVITYSQLENGTVKINCAPLGVIASQDILLFQLVTSTTKQVLRSAPHYVEKSQIFANHCKVKMQISKPEKNTGIGIKYFLIQLTSEHFANIISANKSSYKAIAKNENNFIEATGYINPENSDQINFVMKCHENNDSSCIAASVNDKISLNIEDKEGNSVFSMKFTIEQKDIDTFCKNIIPEEIS